MQEIRQATGLQNPNIPSPAKKNRSKNKDSSTSLVRLADKKSIRDIIQART